MAERYHNSKMGPSYYDSYASRRDQERQDGSMISEDHSAIANLPQNVMIKAYPKPEYARYDLNDTIAVVDNQMRADNKGKKGGAFPEKY